MGVPWPEKNPLFSLYGSTTLLTEHSNPLGGSLLTGLTVLPTRPMTPDEYLRSILIREAVDTGPLSPVRSVQSRLQPIIAAWANAYLLAFHPSGSFMKGTANKTGTDIDLFISLSENTRESLKEIYDKLFIRMKDAGYQPKRQNVSINVNVNGRDVDLVPAKRQNALTGAHSLYRRKADTWTKTDVALHVGLVRRSNRLNEIRVLKLWRDQNRLEFPSFYLELIVMEALSGRATRPFSSLGENVWNVFEYLRDKFEVARVTDPANTNNVISDDLTITEKAAVAAAAKRALYATKWNQIVT